MVQEKTPSVTMRIRIADSELEVTGPRTFVEGKIAEFIALRRQADPARTTSEPTDVIPGTPPTEGKRLSPAQFFRKTNPQTNVDRTLIAGYYLEKYDNFDNFTAAELKTTIKNAKVPPPTNVNDMINSNIRKGFMMAAGDKDTRRAFVLTSDGEDAVNQMLAQ